VLGNISCIAGNVPASIVMTGTRAQVKETAGSLSRRARRAEATYWPGAQASTKGTPTTLRVMMEAGIRVWDI